MMFLHIFVALAGIIVTSFCYLSPSMSKLYAAAVLAGITLATGISLVMSHPASLTQSCIMGLMYFGAVGYGIISAKNKLVLNTLTSSFGGAGNDAISGDDILYRTVGDIIDGGSGKNTILVEKPKDPMA